MDRRRAGITLVTVAALLLAACGAAFCQRYRVIAEKATAHAYEAFPCVTKLANGDLLSVFYAGYGHVSLPREDLPNGGAIAAVRSTDGGRTWSEPTIIIDTPLDDRDSSVVQLSDGRLLCNFFVYRGETPPEGALMAECMVAESTDNGETWSEPWTVAPHFTGAEAVSAPILELDDGDLLMPIYGFDAGESRANYESGVIRSADGGKTWGDYVMIDDDPAHAACEPALCKLPDGRILCMMRPTMVQSYSDDGGRTWTEPNQVGFRGDAPDVIHTSEGLLVCAARLNGTSAIVSDDLGETWRGPYQIDTVGGAYASLVEMEDGSILCVYYEEGAGSNIRATFFRAGVDGIVTFWPE
jgi:sialidase-1